MILTKNYWLFNCPNTYFNKKKIIINIINKFFNHVILSFKTKTTIVIIDEQKTIFRLQVALLLYSTYFMGIKVISFCRV